MDEISRHNWLGPHLHTHVQTIKMVLYANGWRRIYFQIKCYHGLRLCLLLCRKHCVHTRQICALKVTLHTLRTHWDRFADRSIFVNCFLCGRIDLLKSNQSRQRTISTITDGCWLQYYCYSPIPSPFYMNVCILYMFIVKLPVY